MRLGTCRVCEIPEEKHWRAVFGHHPYQRVTLLDVLVDWLSDGR